MKPAASPPPDSWADLPPELRARLETRLQQARLSAGAPAGVPLRSPGLPIPLSPQQEQLWFLQQLDPQSTAYNQAVALRLTGRLDIELLRRCLTEIVRRHEILRTTIVPSAGVPFQVVQPAAELPLKLSDVRSHPPEDRQALAVEQAGQDLRLPFDLAREPPLRVRLTRLADEEHLLFLTIHHIAFDGWSRSILRGELSALYAAFDSGKPSPLAEPRLQYGDYAQWQRSGLERERLGQVLDYWSAALAGAPDVLDLHPDRPRRRAPTHAGGRRSRQLPAELVERLRSLAAERGVTVQMVLLAAFALLLFERSGQQDLIIGCPTTTRDRVELEPLIGFFVNTLPLRIRLPLDLRFTDLLRQVRQDSLAGLEQRQVPIQALVNRIHPTRDLARPTLFQTTLQLRSFPPYPGAVSGLRIEETRIEPVSAVYDLNLEAAETAEGMACWLIYNADLFDASTVDGLLDRFTAILAAALAEPDQPLGRLAGPPPSVPEAAAATRRTAPGLEDLFLASNLSMPQLVLWTGQKLRPETTLYNVSFAFTIHGPLDQPAFAAALASLVEDCDALRSVIEERQGIPSWRLLPQAAAALEVVDLRGEGDPQAAARRWLEQRSRRPFDLSRRLYDSALLALPDTCWIWFLKLHHLISDLGSVETLFRQIERRYRAIQQGAPPRMPLPSHLARTARLRQEALAGGQRPSIPSPEPPDSQAAEPLRPYGGPPPGMAVRATRVTLRLGTERTRRLRKLAVRLADPGISPDRSLLHLLGAVVLGTLHRIGGPAELALGIPYHNRRTEADREIVGLVMEVLPLRIRVAGSESFSNLALRFGREFEQRRAHRPAPQHNPIHRRLYEVELNLAPQAFLGFDGFPVETEWLDLGEVDDSLTLQAYDFSGSGDLCLRLAFNEAVFPAAQRRLAAEHFERLLDACLADPDQVLDQVDMLSPDEREQALVAFNRTGRTFPSRVSLVRLLADRAAASPDRIAVDGGKRAMTYGELERRAGAIARVLKARGVGRDRVIGLCAGRSCDMLAGFLGILKAGAAYLPLDPELPGARLQTMLRTTGCRLVLADRSSGVALPDLEVETVWLDALPDEAAVADGAGDGDAGPDSLAYAIFTSGSSGTPKAVAVEHRALVNFGTWAVEAFGLGPEDRILQFASLSWDASLEEIVPCLLSGAALVLRPDPMLDSYAEFLRQCQALEITVLTLPTAFWHGLADEIISGSARLPDCVRLVNLGGEPVSARRVREWSAHVRPGVRLVNTYGLTESAAVATMCDLSRVELDERQPTAPIGEPIANARVYVLNPAMKPVPDGVEGELWIGGVGLARGYLNDPELTAARFVPDPFSDDPAARLLRTGDMVRRLAAGGLVHAGRRDEQIKVRGIRVEPAEIEACLCRDPAVAAAAVVARPVEGGRGASGDRQLTAYVVPDPAQGSVFDPASLRRFLRQQLPAYMLPTVIVPIDRLPLTSSGKVDRKALPDAAPSRSREPGEAVQPHNSLELQLTAIWEATLGLHPIGTNEDFFDLGGDSLLAVRLFSAIERTTGIRAPLALLFEAPTISRLASRIQEGGWEAEGDPLVAVQIGGSRPPLYCVHWLGGNVLVYRELAAHLGPDQPVFGLQARGVGGRQPPHTRLEDMARHYVASVLRHQPDGPYYLAGASLGGKVAFEMAQQLTAAGREVALVALFDTRGEMDAPPVPFDSRLRHHAERLRDRRAFDRVRYLAERIAARLRRELTALMIRARLPLPGWLWDLKVTTYLAARNYHPRHYPGKVILFRASQHSAGFGGDPFLGWDRVAGGGIEVHQIPGDHVSLMRLPGVRKLAEELTGCLRQASGRA